MLKWLIYYLFCLIEELLKLLLVNCCKKCMKIFRVLKIKILNIFHDMY